jgi:hypothetical protein
VNFLRRKASYEKEGGRRVWGYGDGRAEDEKERGDIRRVQGETYDRYGGMAVTSLFAVSVDLASSVYEEQS